MPRPSPELHHGTGAKMSPFPAPKDFQPFHGYYYLTAKFPCSLKQNLMYMNMLLHGKIAKQNKVFTLSHFSLLIVHSQKCLVSIPSFPAPGEILWYSVTWICVDTHRHTHAFPSWDFSSVFKWQILLCLQYAQLSYLYLMDALLHCQENPKCPEQGLSLGWL